MLKKEGKKTVIEHDGKKFEITVEGMKRKQALKLAKLLKKHKDEPEILVEELIKLGVYVKRIEE